MPKNKNLLAIGLITSLFFIWGFALNLNSILIPHLKKACQLTDFQSSFVDSAAYIAYFVFAIPAATFMKKYGYKGGILLGLILFTTGAFLFYPASEVRYYGFFLVALFVMFSGSSFLETAANPYITALGEPEGATRRLNFSQSFNGLAATLAPFIGGTFILSGKSLSAAQEAAMSPAQLNAYLGKEASAVQIPFLVIGSVVLIVAFMIWRTSLPVIVEEGEGNDEHSDKPISEQYTALFKEGRFMFGVFAEFLYVGAQAGVTSFFIRFAGRVAGMEEKPASHILAIAMFCFMVGRFLGTFLMKFISPVKLLVTYSLANVILILTAVFSKGQYPVYALIGVAFFMSIMFPTIFSLSVRGLGRKTKEGSSLLIMAIVGGAVFPPIMGQVSDASNIQWAYLVPGFCFFGILLFAWKNLKVKELTISGSH